MEMAATFGERHIPYVESDIAIIPVPFEGTASYGKGTVNGPSALLAASYNAEMFDIVTRRDYDLLRVSVLPAVDVDGVIEDVMARIETETGKVLNDSKKPFLLGGEHSITGPAVKAVVSHYAKHGGSAIGVIQFDAHADLRDEYSGTKYSHASVMRRVLESAKAVQIGIRSCSKEEFSFINDRKLPLFTAPASRDVAAVERAIVKLPDRVYLTVDIDVFDSSIMPSTGTPEPGGLGWEEVNALIDMIASHKEIVAADIVELAPIPGMPAPDFLSSRLAFNMLWHMSRFGR